MLVTRGDLLAKMGHADDAEKLYQEAELMEREGSEQERPQPGALARFLAEGGRSHAVSCS
jgi:hypothetical protein